MELTQLVLFGTLGATGVPVSCLRTRCALRLLSCGGIPLLLTASRWSFVELLFSKGNGVDVLIFVVGRNDGFGDAHSAERFGDMTDSSIFLSHHYSSECNLNNRFVTYILSKNIQSLL